MIIENWRKQKSILLLNPRLRKEELIKYNEMFDQYKNQFTNHVFIATSGSTLESQNVLKLVVLSKYSLERSAESVSSFLKIDKDDKLLASLPVFHVGGLGIYLRGVCSNVAVVDYWSENRKWQPEKFVETISENNISVVSIVPTQLYDLVNKEILAPKSLRVVLVGGDSLSEELYRSGKKLSWPLIPTYGSTECSSQVATAELSTAKKNLLEFPKLRLMDHIHVQTDPDNFLQFKGDSIFEGYLQSSLELNEKVVFKGSKDNGWFTSQDKGEVTVLDKKIFLNILGRSSDFIKIKGERVDLKKLNRTLDKLSKSKTGEFIILDEDDSRDGKKLALFSTGSESSCKQLQNSFNKLVSPFERVLEIRRLKVFPKSPLGKILIGELKNCFLLNEE